jgi:hypothetical protein
MGNDSPDMDVSVISRVFTNHFDLLAARTFGFDPAQLFLPALGIGVLTIIMISTRNRIKRSQSSSRPSAMECYAELHDERGATRDLEAVMMELDQLSRQIHGRLDTKLAKLEALIRDADQRIEKLARLQRASAGEPTIDVTLEPEAPGRPADPPPPPAEPNSHEAVYRFADSGLKPVEIASELGRNTGEIELILSLRRAKSQTG